jgi:hypothetical protein
MIIASGWNAFVTRAAGVILKEYATYAGILSGQAIVFTVTDNDGDGVFEVGEDIDILETIPAQFTLSTSNTWDTVIPTPQWPPGSVLTYGPYRKQFSVTNNGPNQLLGVHVRVNQSELYREWAYADGSILGSAYGGGSDPAAGSRMWAGIDPDTPPTPPYPFDRVSPWEQTMPVGNTKFFDIVASTPADLEDKADERKFIRTSRNDVAAGATSMERKTVYTIDSATEFEYLTFMKTPINTTMTYVTNATGIYSLIYDQDTTPADGSLDITGLGVPVGAAGFVGAISEQTMNAALFGALDNDNLWVFVADTGANPDVFSLVAVDTDNDNVITDETPMDLAAGEPDNSNAFLTGLTGLLWYLALNDTDSSNSATPGDTGIASFVIANDIAGQPPSPGGLITLPTGLQVPFNVDVEPVDMTQGGYQSSGIPGGALRTAGDPMTLYNYYYGSVPMIDSGPNNILGDGDDTQNRFYILNTIDPFNNSFPMPFAGGVPWPYCAFYGDLDMDGLFEAVGSAASVGEEPEEFGNILAGPYGTEQDYPMYVVEPILSEDVPIGLTGANTLHQWQFVRVSEGDNWIAQGANSGDDIYGTSTLTFSDPNYQDRIVLGRGPDNIAGTADDTAFPADPTTYGTDSDDIPVATGSGDLFDPFTNSLVSPSGNSFYYKEIPENPSGSGNDVNWNGDGDFTDTFAALIVPLMSEALYGGGTDLNFDTTTTQDLVDSVILNGESPMDYDWTDNAIGNTGDDLITGYTGGSIGDADCTFDSLHYQLWKIDTVTGEFSVVGDTYSPNSVSQPGSFQETTLDVSQVSSPSASSGSVQSSTSVFNTIDPTADLAAVTNLQPTPIAFWSPMWTFWTGQFGNGGVGTWGTDHWVVLIDPSVDGVFDRVLVDLSNNDIVYGEAQTAVGTQRSMSGSAFWLYQIFFEWQNSASTGIGQLGYPGWSTYNLNDDGDTTDIFLLFAKAPRWIGNHISEAYPESGASPPFSSTGSVNDFPECDNDQGNNPASEVSYFWWGLLNEATDFPVPTDLNNDFDTTDIYDYMLKAEAQSQTDSSPFPDAWPNWAPEPIDNINAAVFDTDNDNTLADESQIQNGGTVQFGSGQVFTVTISEQPCTLDWDIQLSAAATGTYTVKILVEGYDDINNNGQIDAGEPPRSAVITVNIIVP